jgi:hypothetical protein
MYLPHKEGKCMLSIQNACIVKEEARGGGDYKMWGHCDDDEGASLRRRSRALTFYNPRRSGASPGIIPWVGENLPECLHMYIMLLRSYSMFTFNCQCSVSYSSFPQSCSILTVFHSVPNLLKLVPRDISSHAKRSRAFESD